MISELVQSEVDARRLPDANVSSRVRLLFPTGGETTHGALGNLTYALLTHEGEWQRIVQSPERIETIVEESLRWGAPRNPGVPGAAR